MSSATFGEGLNKPKCTLTSQLVDIAEGFAFLSAELWVFQSISTNMALIALVAIIQKDIPGEQWKSEPACREDMGKGRDCLRPRPCSPDFGHWESSVSLG